MSVKTGQILKRCFSWKGRAKRIEFFLILGIYFFLLFFSVTFLQNNYFIAFILLLFMFCIQVLALIPGEKLDNKYGKNPYSNKKLL